MKVRLICSDRIREAVSELALRRNLVLDDCAGTSLVERGYEPPEGGIAVLFDPLNLDELIGFLDALERSPVSYEGDTIVGKRDECFEILRLDDIYFFNADDNDTWSRTKNGVYGVRKKLYELEQALSGRGFIRVNKSYVVNILKVSEIFPWFGGKLLLRFGDIKTDVEVSRRNTPPFREFIGM